MTTPTGTITFLFTDIEGSTRRWDERPEAMQAALARHDTILRASVERHGGHVFKTVGDAFHAAFATASQALRAAVEGQRALTDSGWGGGVRMALHTGVADERDGDYFGPPLNRAARLRDAGHGGQILLSGVTAGLVRGLLPEGVELRDLGVHRLRDLAEPEQIHQAAVWGLPAAFPPLQVADAPRGNLPAALTSFVGRTHEIAEVRRLLAETRLLTLSGSGGVGKTRLAIEAAATVADAYPQGVWLVELAALADPAALPAAVAAALGIREEKDRPLLETALDALRPRRLLLILDNCEHLIAAVAGLADRLLRACPDLRILATSREALGIAGEVAWLVPSLPLPEPGTDDPESVSGSDAVRLFVDRARAAAPGFALTPATAPAVAEICRRLDGIPLAIELAAARAKALSVEQIAARLGDRFRLLTGGSRTALPRQQTLRAAIDWSYDLLSEAERTLLQRLSAFAGGWDLDAAEAVCAGDGIAAGEVLDLLAGLVDKSLVQTEDGADGTRRYRLFETVRQYAREKLLDAGGASAVRAHHRDWYTGLAEEAEPNLETAAQWRWVARLEREQENLRAAFEWSAAAGEPEPALRLAGALRRYWAMIGRVGEGREWLEEGFAIEGPVVPVVRAKALYALSSMSAFSTGYRPDLAAEAVAIYRRLDDTRGVGRTLVGLAIQAEREGDLARGEALYGEAVALARRVGDTHAEGGALHQLAHLRERRDHSARAAAVFEESLACFRRAGDSVLTLLLLADAALSAQKLGDTARAAARETEALTLLATVGERGTAPIVLVRLAEVAHLRGDYAGAVRLLERSAALSRERGTRIPAAEASAHLFAAHLALGEIERAAAALHEALVRRHDLPPTFQTPDLLAMTAALAATRREPERAARLLGAAHAERERLGLIASPSFVEAADAADRSARAALDEDAFAAAHAEGHALSLDAGVALALEVSAMDAARSV